MRKVLIISFLFLSFYQLQASCCGSGGISILPSGGEISQNSIFVIGFQERDFPFTKDLLGANIYLKSETGRRVKLNVIDMVKGPRSGVTLVLKAKRKLKRGKTVSIEMVGFDDKGSGFKARIGKKKWTVSYKKDRLAPKFVGVPKATFDSPVIETEEGRIISYNSAGSVVLRGQLEFVDGEKVKPNQVLLELTVQDGSGTRFFATVSNGKFAIQSSICGGNFDVEYQKDYTFKVRLMDFSGNKSKDYKLLGVSTKF